MRYSQPHRAAPNFSEHIRSSSTKRKHFYDTTITMTPNDNRDSFILNRKRKSGSFDKLSLEKSNYSHTKTNSRAENLDYKVT